MSTSGVSSWTLQRDAIINSALRKLGVLADGVVASANQITTGAEALNSMLKLMETKGMPIWKIIDYNFTTVANQNTYNIGNGLALNTPAPLKVLQALRVITPNGTNTPMDVTNHYDFNLLPITAAAGNPIKLFYQPFAQSGNIRLWPTPLDTSNTIYMSYHAPFTDMVNSTDDLDFPPYWTDAVIYNLAWRLAPEYGASKEDRAAIRTEAQFFEEEALSFGTEEGSLKFQPDWQGKR